MIENFIKMYARPVRVEAIYLLTKKSLSPTTQSSSSTAYLSQPAQKLKDRGEGEGLDGGEMADDDDDDRVRREKRVLQRK